MFNANAGDPATNILMDVRDKYPGYTHIALRVASIPEAVDALNENGIPIAQGPVSFGIGTHQHHYRGEFDREAAEVLNSFNWHRSHPVPRTSSSFHPFGIVWRKDFHPP